MIDDFEATHRSEDPERGAPGPDDDWEGWRSEFRSHLDDPE
jgi:hypothetical protein